MKPVLVKKAYLPTIDEARGVSLDDIQSLRWIPERHRKTFAQPVSVSRSKKMGLGQTVPWEIDVAQQEHGVPLPGLLHEDLESINPQRDVTGTWVGPSNIGTLLQPDFTFNPMKEAGILLGTTETPHWWRTQTQGAKSPAGEGFQYGGFPKESFVEIPRPNNATPFDIEGGAYGALTGLNEPTPEMLDFLSQFPQEQGTDRWEQTMGAPITEQQLIDQGLITPLSYEQRIVDSPFLPRKVASEPMDIAFQLLKDNNMEEYMEDAFDLGYPLLSYDELHDKQKQIVDTIAGAPSSYWNDPVSGELETENYSGMFQQDEHHLYPDEAFDEYLRYIQHFHDASAKISAMPHEEQMKIMSHYSNQHMLPNEEKEEHPLHPAKVALDKMAEEHEHWNVEDPHGDFYDRYNEPKSSQGGASRMAGGFHRSEPIDIAMRLLKNEPADYADTYQRVRNNTGADGEYMTDEELNAIDERYSELHDDEKHLEEYYNLLEAIELEKKRRAEGSFDGLGHNEETGFTRSEPMEIAFQLLKERVSPEAKRHKLEYDKKYESSPERVKYREDLNRERRRRGIYGSHDHKDISHTEGGKLTLEGEHENRARHFKDKGTLREL